MACSNHHRGSSSSNSLLLHIDLNAPPQDDDDSREAATRKSECGSNLSEIISQEKCHDDETTRTMHRTEQKGKGIAKCTREQRWNALVDMAVDAHEREDKSEEHAEESKDDEEEEAEKVVLKKKARKKKRNRRASNIDDDDEEVFEVPIVRSTRERAVAMPKRYKDSFLGPLSAITAASEAAPRRKSAANRRSR